MPRHLIELDPMPAKQESSAERVQMVREQWLFGLELKRRALRLASPSLSATEIERQLERWLQDDE